MDLMKVYTSTDFTGRWPVGTAAVVVAEDEIQARWLLSELFEFHHLDSEGGPGGFTVHELETDKPEARMLNNGEY